MTLRQFEQLAAVAHAGETLLVDEVVVDPFDLARSPLARRHRDRQHHFLLLLGEERACDRRLAGARRRGEHQHHAAAQRPVCFSWHCPGASRFWIFSRNWSTTAFSSRPIAVKERSPALAQSVLTSRLNS